MIRQELELGAVLQTISDIISGKSAVLAAWHNYVSFI
jgi:hypothetical protein